MCEESLKGLLDKLRWAEGLQARPPENSAQADGLWAVKWIQGGVSAGALRATVESKQGGCELSLFGPLRTNARQLAQQAVSGGEPHSAAERHWVMALRHLRTLKLRPTVISRDDHTRLLVTIHPDGALETQEQRYQGGSGNLTLRAELPRKPKPWSTPWQPEFSCLQDRLPYCSIPVSLRGEKISQIDRYRRTQTVMSWMEPALGGEPYLHATGNPRQILSPHLVEKAPGKEEKKLCSLVFNLALVPPGEGRARVWWVKDGVLVGPVQLVGPTGAAEIVIVCAGDRPGSLSEWAARDAWTFFPDKLVLSVARRLAGGLDSLLPQLAAREGFSDHLLHQANAVTGYRHLFGIRGRPCVALGGPFHASLKAFSLRSSLELHKG